MSRPLTPRARRFAALVPVAVLATIAAAPAAAQDPSGSTDAAGRYTTPLAEVCPPTIVVQTNWYPESDHGYVYQLIGEGGTVDAARQIYSGPLGSTGVNLEIRAGGPAIGFQLVSSLLQQDDTITFGFVGTDEAIQESAEAPSVAVFANYDKNPQIFLWGDTSLDFASVADIGKSGIPVLAFEGSPYLDIFVNKGLLTREQIDGSYDGTPGRFVAADGKVAQQGFATNEPYAYENEVEAWSRPVEFLLVHDEYPVYQSALSVRADRLEELRPCLAAVVPLFQQALKDYVTAPEPVNAVLADYVGQLNAGFQLSPESLAAAAATQLELGLVQNGVDGILGSFEDGRVQRLIDDIAPAITATGKEIKEGLAPADLVTNEFLDPDISL